MHWLQTQAAWNRPDQPGHPNVWINKIHWTHPKRCILTGLSLNNSIINTKSIKETFVFLIFDKQRLSQKKSGQCWRGALQIEAVRSMWSLQCPNFRCDVSWHGWDCFSLSDPLGSDQGQLQPWICVRSDPCRWSDVFFCKEGELRVTKDSSASYHPSSYL